MQFCNEKNVPFLAQNGGHGWAITLAVIQSNGIIINLAGLNQITFAPNKTQVMFQGGVLISDLVNAASNESVLVPTGTCNCVGVLGAVLGGGVGNLMGLYGMGVDNILSFNMVDAEGQAITVSPTENTDLWFAMRGAGPNFGIVTSVVYKSYPVSDSSGLSAWLGPLIFTEPQLSSLISAINTLDLQPEMALTLLFVNSGNVTAPPAILASVFYYGSEAAGKAAFAPLYNVGPVADETAVTPYAEWNSANDVACGKGERKPDFGAGLANMDANAWQDVYNLFSQFIQLPGAENTTVMMDAYSLAAAQEVSDTATAYPFRSSIKFNAIWSAVYPDPSLDATAIQYGNQARDLWRTSSGLSQNET